MSGRLQDDEMLPSLGFWQHPPKEDRDPELR